MLFAVGLVDAALPGHAIGAEQHQDEGIFDSPSPRRTVFTVEEGTWMSLDVSADGSTVVFDLLGDLYTVPVTGGEARQLTAGPAFDAQPRYSPDGRQIVFVSDRSGADNLWVLDVSHGNLHQVTDEQRAFFVSPEWAPDGEQIIASRNTAIDTFDRNYQLFSYRLSGDSVEDRQLTGNCESSADNVLGAAFGPDAGELFAAVEAGPSWPSVGNWTIARVDTTTGEVSQFARELSSAFRPVLSPDGRYIVYGTRWKGATRLKLVERDSRRERWLISELGGDAEGETPTRDLLPGAAFTPDGRALVVSHHGRLWRVEVPGGDAVPIPFRAEVEVELAPLARFDYSIDDEAVTARRIEQPQLSPDGRWLAFSALNRLWLQDLASGESPIQVSKGRDGAFFPAWSPDGRYLAYVTWNDLQGGDIWRVRPGERAEPERLSRQRALYEKLTYSPDGRRLVAARGSLYERARFYSEIKNKGRGQSSELVWLPADGGEATPIAAINAMPRWASSHYGMPHFSLDASQVYFNDPVDGLVAVSWDGSGRHTVLRVEGPTWEQERWLENRNVPADEIIISPDARQAVALLHDQVWLLDIPPDNSDERLVILPDAADGVRARRLSVEGGEFVNWAHGGHAVAWSLGSTFFVRELGASSRLQRHDVQVRVAADKPRGALTLRGARIVTMHGGEVLEDADLVIVDNRISAVGPRGSVEIPMGASILDVGGNTILPGYVDIHWHGDRPWGVHRAQTWEDLAALAYGVTSTRDPQPTTMDVLTYADRRAANAERGPRIFSTGRGIFLSDAIDGPDDALAVARKYHSFFDTETIKDYMIHADRAPHRWLADAARQHRLTITAESNSDFRSSIARIFDGYGGLEHMASATAYYDDLVTLIASSGTTVTPTVLEGQVGGQELLSYYAHRHGLYDDEKVARFFPEAEIEYLSLVASKGRLGRRFTVRQRTTPVAAILEAGGSIGLGTHGAVHGLGAHWVLWTFVDGGMDPHEALRVATILSAEAIGHGRNFGSIEAGKLADFQILEGNPLEDIRETLSLRYVAVNGRLYESDTLDEVWPRRRSLGRQWWWPTAGEGGDQ